MSQEIVSSDILTNYFNKLVLWAEEGDGPDEDSKTVQQYQIADDQVEGKALLRHNGVLHEVRVCHECEEEDCEHQTTQPEGSTLCSISLSLAENLGLEWFEEDQGEIAEDGKDDGSEYIFNTIPVYLVPKQ